MEKAQEEIDRSSSEIRSLRRALIVSGGDIDREFARDIIKKHTYKYIIAADAGLRFLYEEEIIPTHIVGDFDSLEQEILEFYSGNPKVVIRMFSPIKDATDTELALRLAVELKSTEIYLIGGGGARMDHTIGNIQSMCIPLKAGIPCIMADPYNRIELLDHSTVIRRQEAFGKYLSFFSLGGAVRQLTLTGVKYPLAAHDLTTADSLGVSNEITDEEAAVSFSKGILIMIQSKDGHC